MDLRCPSLWSFGQKVSIFLEALISCAVTMHFCMIATALGQSDEREREREIGRERGGGRREEVREAFTPTVCILQISFSNFYV